MDYMDFLKNPVFHLTRIDKVRRADGKYDYHHVLRYETDEGYVEHVLKSVARVTYSGENYIILLPLDREAFANGQIVLPENAAFLYRLVGDGLDYERVFDNTLAEAVFAKYRTTYPAPYADNALTVLEHYFEHDPQEIKFEYVDEPNDGKDGVIILRNPNGDEVPFGVLGSIAYRGALYLLVTLEEELAASLGLPENGALVFRWGTGEHPRPLYLVTDGELASAVVEARNKLVSGE